MATLTNISINARSLNGLITISDGQGTVIEDGQIDTDLLQADVLEVQQLNATNFTTNAMIANSLQLLRTSTTAVNNLLGVVVDIGKLTQNMYFDTVARQVQIWNDTATSQLMTIDLDNNSIGTQGSLSAQALTTNSLICNTSITTNTFLQNLGLGGGTSYSWNFGDRNIIYLSPFSPYTFNLPLVPSSSYHGTNVYIFMLNSSGITITTPFGPPSKTFLDETNALVQTKTYSSNIRYFQFTAFGSASAIVQWRLTNIQSITKDYADSNYGSLAGSNAFTGTNTFNTNLPTSTQTPTTPTQLITKTYADTTFQPTGSYATLGGSNAFTGTNTFNTHLPTSTLTPTSYDQFITQYGGDLRYQQLANVAIYIKNDANGNSVLLGSGPTTPISGYDNFTAGIQAGEFLTSGYSNTAISKYALSSCTTGYDNVACGVGSMFISDNGNGNSCFGNYSGQGISDGYDNVMLGLGASVSNGSIHNAVAIGAGSTAEADYEFVLGWDNNIITIPNKVKISSCQFTGTPTTFTINWRTNEYVVVNSATCDQINLPQAIDPTTIHVGACFHICRTHLSTSNLVISAFGTEKINWKGSLHSFVPIDSWVMSISFVCVDNVAGNGVWTVFTYNDRVTLANDANKIQTLSDSTNVNYPVCFTTIATTGYNNVHANSSLNYNPSTSLLTVPNVVLPNKLTLQSSTVYNTASVTLTIGSTLNDNIILQSNTVTQIYLPSSYIDANIGCSFTITRAYTPIITDVINIDTAGGAQFVAADFAIGPTEWFMDYSITTVRLTLTKISTLYTWVLSYTRRIAILADTTSNINYPVLFAPLDDNAQEIFADSTNINYNPSTDTLNVNNISTTKPILEKQDTGVEVSTTTNINVDPQAGQYSLYKFCNMGVGIITYRLPTITASTVGWRFMVKRMYGSNMNVCTFNPSAFTTQPIIFDTTAVPSTASYNMSTIQSMFEFVTAITQVGGFTGTFTNTAGSTTITINTILVGNIIFLGGKINLNGVTKTVVAYGTGRGQAGTYIVDTAIIAANTTQPFTSIESYGYILTNFN